MRAGCASLLLYVLLYGLDTYAPRRLIIRSVIPSTAAAVLGRHVLTTVRTAQHPTYRNQAASLQVLSAFVLPQKTLCQDPKV